MNPIEKLLLETIQNLKSLDYKKTVEEQDGVFLEMEETLAYALTFIKED